MSEDETSLERGKFSECPLVRSLRLPEKRNGGKRDCGVKRGRDEKREGRNEGGMKGKGEDHRGTCGRWNRVKNENHIMASHTHTHTHTHISTHTQQSSFEQGWVTGWGEGRKQRKRESYRGFPHHEKNTLTKNPPTKIKELLSD